MKATDLNCHPVLVKDERQSGASVFNDLALQLLKYQRTFVLGFQVPFRKKDLHVSHMKIKGIKTKSDFANFILKIIFCFTRFYLYTMALGFIFLFALV